jgi:ABC-type sugar transport system ATPase subunit
MDVQDGIDQALRLSAQDNPAPLLEVKGISKSFANVTVLKNITFTLRSGEIMMLVGENGAGKSTLKNILSGLQAPSGGSLSVKGEQCARFTPDQVSSFGIGTIHQELSLFANLSVAENIFMPDLLGRHGRVAWKEMRGVATRLLRDTLSSDINPDSNVGSLSLGERQVVEIAKAVHRASSLLILDEPTTCLSIPERQRLFDVVRRLRSAGYGIIYITHFLDEVYALADHIAVLRDGVLVASGTPQELPADALTRAMVGRQMAASTYEPAELSQTVPPVLSVRSFGDSDCVHDVSFDLRQGEILGIAGLMGAGRSELAEMIIGLRPAQGEVHLSGRHLERRSVKRAAAEGLVLVSEDRRRDQAFLSRPVRENVTAPGLKRVVAGMLRLIQPSREADIATGIVGKYGVQPSQPETHMVNLSGGNQQKAIIGRWLNENPKVCILDEPTKGVDVGARASIHDLIMELSRKGTAFILISSDLPELLDLSHRVMVLHKGRSAGFVERTRFNPDEIITMASTGGVGGNSAGRMREIA